jgi:predicted  nucleic acid-binding Zn-ribbon protein
VGFNLEWFCYGGRLIEKDIPKSIKVDLQRANRTFKKHEATFLPILEKKFTSEKFKKESISELDPDALALIDRLNKSLHKIDSGVLKTWTNYIRKQKELFTTAKLSISKNVLERLSDLKLPEHYDKKWYESRKKTDDYIVNLVTHIEKLRNERDELRSSLESCEDELRVCEDLHDMKVTDHSVVKAFYRS